MEKQSVINKTKKLQGGKITPVLLPVLYSFIVQSAVFIAACILALLTDIGSEDYYIISVLALSVGSAASGFISGKKKREKGMLYGTLHALPSNIFYIIFSVALNGFKFDYNIFLSLALLVACSAAGGVISVNMRPKTRIKARRTKR